MYIKSDIKNMDFSFLGKFDAIVVDPPWIEYRKRVQKVF
jgi:tRNA1(Val) A37 N6-methylase TrmN6